LDAATDVERAKYAILCMRTVPEELGVLQRRGGVIGFGGWVT